MRRRFETVEKTQKKSRRFVTAKPKSYKSSTNESMDNFLSASSEDFISLLNTAEPELNQRQINIGEELLSTPSLPKSRSMSRNRSKLMFDELGTKYPKRSSNPPTPQKRINDNNNLSLQTQIDWEKVILLVSGLIIGIVVMSLFR